MEGEHLLHTDAVGDAADGEGLLNAAVFLGNDGSLTFRCTRTVSPTWTTGGSSLVYLSVKAFIRSISISSCCIGVHASHPAALQNRRGGGRGPPVISD